MATQTNTIEPNVLDRVISWVSPTWGYKRLAAKAATRAARAYYDGATSTRRGASIRRSGADANVVSYRDLNRLRTGARDLKRNNPHARRGIEAIVSNVVGKGIAPMFVRDGARADDIRALAKDHLETTECDTEGRNTYAGIQSLAMETIVSSGGVLIRRRFRRSSDPISVPLQFQVLEPDYLDESKDGPTENGGQIIQGVEYDPIGRIRGYWLFRDHPGSRRLTMRSDFVSAIEVAHVFRTDRPGQARGIPWLAPVMLRIQDFADYEEAQLVRQKIAACFAGFITENYSAGLGAPFGATENEDGEIIDTIEPGIMERLPPGTDVSFADPPSVEGYGDYSKTSLRSIAAGLGISYEALTGDLENVNFSSGKMGRLEFQRNIERWQTLMLIPQLCDKLMGWWLEAVALQGGRVEDVDVRHVVPQVGQIDPTREGPADIKEIKGGTKTLFQVIRERGRDPVEHLREWKEANDLLEELGISLSSMSSGGGGGFESGDDEGDGDEDPELTDQEMDMIVELLRERGYTVSGNGAS